MESAIENEKEIVDPFCDPQYPVRVNYETVLDAAEKIKGGVIRTPCTVSRFVFEECCKLIGLQKENKT